MGNLDDIDVVTFVIVVDMDVDMDVDTFCEAVDVPTPSVAEPVVDDDDVDPIGRLFPSTRTRMTLLVKIGKKKTPLLRRILRQKTARRIEKIVQASTSRISRP